MGSRRHFSSADEAASGEFSLAGLISRDFFVFEDEREEAAARETVRALDPLPVFFLVVHLVCGLALTVPLGVDSPALAPVGAITGGLVLLDFGLWFVCRSRAPSSWPAHVAVRGAALYAIAAGGAWCALALLLGADEGMSSPLAALALAAGFVALPLALLSFPALVALASAAGVTAVVALTGDPLSAALALLLSSCAIGLSAIRARQGLVNLRRRMAIDWNAMRANRFIEEFEQAGRGWFWETTGRGALSYVSDQLAADLKTPAADLIGKPFSDLIGIDDSAEGETSERTLGFHLSARLPFTDVTVRAKTAAEIWWSLSGTPSFDENGRFLGFRGIGSDLTQQRRSEQEINRLAKYDSLTGLPNRA